jgi:hypothetical protein
MQPGRGRETASRLVASCSVASSLWLDFSAHSADTTLNQSTARVESCRLLVENISIPGRSYVSTVGAEYL